MFASEHNNSFTQRHHAQWRLSVHQLHKTHTEDWKRREASDSPTRRESCVATQRIVMALCPLSFQSEQRSEVSSPPDPSHNEHCSQVSHTHIPRDNAMVSRCDVVTVCNAVCLLLSRWWWCNSHLTSIRPCARGNDSIAHVLQCNVLFVGCYAMTSSGWLSQWKC